jgi:outer membrane protein OmpA-like peptidoglycan-associated protein
MKTRSAILLVPLLALAACAGEPRPVSDDPFAHRTMPWPPPRDSAPPPHNPARPPAHTVAPQQGPAGPLTVARVGDYMDSLEMQLRRHLRGVLVARQGDVINLVIPNTALFTQDGGISGDDLLEPLGAILRGYPHVFVAVNGFTDTAGAPDQNLAVSQKRAKLIADALAHEGVPPARISAQGFGETHLRVATGDDKKEPRNRRIEIVLKAKPG